MTVTETFANQYARMSDDELEALAGEKNALTSDARRALDAELAHRVEGGRQVHQDVRMAPSTQTFLGGITAPLRRRPNLAALVCFVSPLLAWGVSRFSWFIAGVASDWVLRADASHLTIRFIHYFVNLRLLASIGVLLFGAASGRIVLSSQTNKLLRIVTALMAAAETLFAVVYLSLLIMGIR